MTHDLTHCPGVQDYAVCTDCLRREAYRDLLQHGGNGTYSMMMPAAETTNICELKITRWANN